jgi:hypothetical protein
MKKMDFMQLKKIVTFRQMIADSMIKQQLDGGRVGSG